MVADMVFDIAKIAATVLPFLGMTVALVVSGYVTLRLGPLKRKQDKLEQKGIERDEKLKTHKTEIDSVRDAIPILPNFEVREERLRREIDRVESRLKMELLKSVAKIAEDNREMREQILNEASNRVGDISSEFLARPAIEHLIELSIGHLRDHELSELFRRIGELERE